LSWIILALPKIGPLASLKLKEPGPVAEKLFIQSFDTVLVNCASSLKMLGSGNIQLVNIDFDTGKDTAPGEYKLADINYGNLVVRLNKNKFDRLNDGLKQNILSFYSHPNAAIATKKGRKEREKINIALEQLKMAPAIAYHTSSLMNSQTAGN